VCKAAWQLAPRGTSEGEYDEKPRASLIDFLLSPKEKDRKGVLEVLD
jgi:hypothetical protein